MDSDPSESPSEPAGTAVPPAAPTPRPEPMLGSPAASAATPPPTPPPATTPPPALAPPPAPPSPPVPPAATPPPPPSPPPGGRGGGDRRRPPPLPQLVTELRELVVAYVKQQTLIPLQQLGRYVGYGLLGSLLLGFGVVFLALGGLRLLQTETGSTFTDDWSWVPYLIMVLVLALGAAAVWLLRGAAANEEEAQ